MSLLTPTHVSELETEVEVAKISHPATDIVEVTLRRADGGQLPRWTPGAHIDVLLGDGDDALVRQYSLCSSPADLTEYRIAVLKEPNSRGGSERIHQLSEGERLTIRGPRNNFPFVTAPRYVFIAGGIGITPIMTMVEEAEAAGAQWELHYGGRTHGSMAFAAELAERGDQVNLVPQDEKGMLDLAGILGTPATGTLVYCCGPEPLLDAVEQACKPWPHGALHVERFAAKEIDAGENAAFEVVLQRSGKTLDVPADKSVFDVMRENGVSVLGSCLEGVCGTCETGVLEGEVDHRDSVLDDDEQAANDCMMVCVSRCRGDRLVLDA